MKFKILLPFLFFLGVFSQERSLCVQSILDIIFVLDSSGSIGYENYQRAKSALASMVGNLNVNPSKINVGLINYSSQTYLITSLVESDQDKSKLINQINGLQYLQGYTATGDALVMAKNEIQSHARFVTPRVVVVFTDGYSNVGHDVYEAARLLKESDATIFSVGIGSGINSVELEEIASTNDKNQKHVFKYENYAELQNGINRIQQSSCEVPAFIYENQPYRLINDQSQIRKFQLKLKSSYRSGLYADIEINNIQGDNHLEISWLIDSKVITVDDLENKKIEKKTKSGKISFFHLLQIPQNANKLFLKLKGIESNNVFDLTIHVY